MKVTMLKCDNCLSVIGQEHQIKTAFLVEWDKVIKNTVVPTQITISDLLPDEKPASNWVAHLCGEQCLSKYVSQWVKMKRDALAQRDESERYPGL
jgi:hypothetical protein